ncbi:hypothetical protein KIM372_17630 [Bombiscardovia nodaiensis]|uniref:YIP1 family protein n=1 Tax=Bombiscardovia nodaiensis TaxID=2932181 RepID=A0ABM8BB68_9BIFI|nr:hypothetical protein KIM372_17630 [Bombiscardovia nodaiensis]
MGNYSNAYSAYNTLTLTGKLWNAACKIGWSWLIFSCICLILLIAKIVQLKSKKVSINGSYEILGLVASAALGSVVVFMTFWRVQDLDYQHWYAVVPFIESSIFLSIFAGILYIPKLMYLRLAESAVAILSVLSLCLGFSIIPSMGIVSNFIGVQLVAPKYQNDISEKGRFVDYLKKQTAGQSLVYFAAASFDLNADLPFNYSLPGSIEKPFPVATAGVDSRDGFNVDFFDAEYVVTSSPVALHMSPDKEQVVVALNNLVQDSSSYVGRHYKVLRQFSFDNSLIVTIYKKISSYEKADVRTLEQTFDRIYPDAPQLFKDRFEKVVANIEK